MRYRGRSHERGGALVEFALVLPAFFVMMLSIMDFGLYFFVQHTLQFATREGARLALVGARSRMPRVTRSRARRRS